MMASVPGVNCFVYGTLMADEVLKKLIKRVPPAKPATLHGFRRHCLKNVVYPAIVPSKPDSTVPGKVLIGLTSQEVNILDVYEAEEYYRESVVPVLEDGTTITADVYIWKPELSDSLLPEDWDYNQWMKNNMHLWVDQLSPNEAHPERVV